MLLDIDSVLDTKQKCVALAWACGAEITEQPAVSYEDSEATVWGVIDKWSGGQPDHLALSKQQVTSIITRFHSMRKAYSRASCKIDAMVATMVEGVADGMLDAELEPTWKQLQGVVSELDETLENARKEIANVCTVAQRAKIMIGLASAGQEANDSLSLCTTWQLGEDLSSDNALATIWDFKHTGQATGQGMREWWVRKCFKELGISHERAASLRSLIEKYASTRSRAEEQAQELMHTMTH